MCDFDDLDPLDIANIAGFIETLEGEQEPKKPHEPSPDDLLEYYDSALGKNVIVDDESDMDGVE